MCSKLCPSRPPAGTVLLFDVSDPIHSATPRQGEQIDNLLRNGLAKSTATGSADSVDYKAKRASLAFTKIHNDGFQWKSKTDRLE